MPGNNMGYRLDKRDDPGKLPGLQRVGSARHLNLQMVDSGGYLALQMVGSEKYSALQMAGLEKYLALQMAYCSLLTLLIIILTTC